MNPEEVVEAFNQHYPVGSKVLLKTGEASGFVPAKTQSEAFLVCGQPVVYLEGGSRPCPIAQLFAPEGEEA
jgi:hypothetical protein